MALHGRIGFARWGLPEMSEPIKAASSDGQVRNGAIEDSSRAARALPRPLKRWRLVRFGGTASAFVRESFGTESARSTPASARRHSGEHAAPQPERGSAQAGC